MSIEWLVKGEPVDNVAECVKATYHIQDVLILAATYGPWIIYLKLIDWNYLLFNSSSRHNVYTVRFPVTDVETSVRSGSHAP